MRSALRTAAVRRRFFVGGIMKAVSIIIPCYNAAEYLDRCMEHLLLQTIGLEKMEIILVDDASTDDGATLRGMMKYERNYPDHVMVIACEQNAGPGAARNIGLAYASGDYIAFVDADDIMDVSMLERMHEAMRKYDTDVVECSYKTFADGEEIYLEKRDRDYLIRIETPQDRGRFLVNSFKTAVWGRLYRRSFLHRNSLSFPENIRYGEDNFFSGLAMLLCGSVYHIGDTLYYYYRNEKGLIRNNTDNGRIRQLAEVMEQYLLALNDRGFFQGVMDGYEEEFEWYMIYKYFMDPVSFIISRQMQDWKEQVSFFRKALLRFFPDACQNRYLNGDVRWKDYVFLLKNDII